MSRNGPTITFQPTSARITVRVADDGDASALVRLAALDSAPVPDRPTLVAEIDGEPVAALPLNAGRAVADPFRRTSAAVEMLELRAAQLRGRRRLVR